MAGSRASEAESLAHYLARVRARALAVYAARSVCAALGVGTSALVLAAIAAGPVVGPAIAHGVVAALLALTLAAGALAAWPVGRLRGLGSARLVAAREPRLGSALRSALELRTAAAPESAALVAAHARSVQAALVELPVSEVVPWRSLRHASVVAGLGGALLAAAVLAGHDGVRLGARALLAPGELRADGVRLAAVVASARAKLIYPSYLDVPASDGPLPSLLEAPRGTTVELTLSPRLEAVQGVLVVGGSSQRLSAAPNGAWFVRFVVREDAPLALRLHDGEHWYEDDGSRRLRALVDQRPEVKLEGPNGRTIELNERLPLRVHARDDHALRGVELIVQVEGRDEQRRRIWSPRGQKEPMKSVVEDSSITAAEAGAQPGDLLTLWLEAQDGDTVSGPNLGVSKPLTFEVATDAQALSLRLPRLREVLDGALDALADRLEVGLPEALPQAVDRAQELQGGAAAWVRDLETLIDAAADEDDDTLDLDQLQGVVDRVRRELSREIALGRGGGRALPAYAAADARIVDEHERDVLILADLLAQGLVDEARGLAKELTGLKDHLKELLSELRKNPSPEAERALLAEIAKAQRRLRELAQSLSRLSNRVPSEFINREALPQNEAGNSLEALQRAVQSGDLGSAEQQLAQLERDIESLNEQLESGGARFRETHQGARDRALDQARSQLDMLSAEQQRLSNRTRDVVKKASERASERAGGSRADPAMQQSADQLARDTGELMDGAGPEGPWLDRAKERMRDAADAMRAGDLAQARNMARHAESQLEQAASSLEQDARMFGGHDGETARRAERARKAEAGVRDLQQRLDQAMPDLSGELGEAERAQLRADAPSQRGVREKAEQIQGELGKQQGENGAPLSPLGERELQPISEAMRRAEQALERGDAQQASREQDDASERLAQLSERMKKRGGGRPGSEGERGKGEREGGQDGDGLESRARVEIPDADAFRGPKERRRRLLDAMREDAPSDYGPAVQRYYQELLR